MPIRERKGKRGATYQADLMIDGVRYKRSFRSREEADLFVAQTRVDVRSGRKVEAARRRADGESVLSMSGLFKRVCRTRWEDKKSAAGLIGRGQLFVSYVGEAVSVVEGFADHSIQAYIGEMETQGLAAATINRRLSAVRVLATVAEELGLLHRVPTLRNRREPPGRHRWFTDQECTEILTYLLHIGEVDYVDLCTFLLDTGARVSEARGLTWAFLPPGSRLVTFYDTKNGENRSVPLTQRCRDIVEKRRLMGQAGPFSSTNAQHDRRILTLLRNRFQWMDETTVLHTFRHTCASRLVQNGVELLRVKNWMGHKSLASTQRYAHLAPEHLEDARDKLEQRIVLELAQK